MNGMNPVHDSLQIAGRVLFVSVMVATSLSWLAVVLAPSSVSLATAIGVSLLAAVILVLTWVVS